MLLLHGLPFLAKFTHWIDFNIQFLKNQILSSRSKCRQNDSGVRDATDRPGTNFQVLSGAKVEKYVCHSAAKEWGEFLHGRSLLGVVCCLYK